ncbi:MAG: hypothetical protein NZM28_10225, partial [Fimbriimonadales bacterium]|nr:hypothetical protein [Fimbriimonadales bacterium]
LLNPIPTPQHLLTLLGACPCPHPLLHRLTHPHHRQPARPLQLPQQPCPIPVQRIPHYQGRLRQPPAPLPRHPL